MFNSDNQYYSRSWRIVGFVATFFIIITIPLYLSVHEVSTEKSKEPHFVGRQTCIECHEAESTSWKGSHHDMAMDSANSETVLGNFDNYEFKHKGQTHRMFKKGEDFYINTLGENGKFEDFKIDYTFGYEPLQQYMVEFEGGNIQCLPIAWDTDKNKWYHLGDTLYPTEDLQANNWLFWTNQAQNWNGMCAECHSTNLKKNYDNETKTYHTTWSEIDVSCEACHGPASEHLVWAKLPENSRPTDNNTGLIVKTSNINNEEYVNLCMNCHSRRAGLNDFTFDSEILNHTNPQLALQPYYHTDGQILDEDYVYTSFTQSKMYINDVQCNDCHDVHSTKLKIRGNGLCLQCHQPEIYDTPKHHFHKMPGDNIEELINNTSAPKYRLGEGALCVNCHMNGKFYMGNDYRRDHSFRIPRPDLTIELGTPNACNDCHKDKNAQWAQQYIKKWYGERERPHYGSVFAMANNANPKAVAELVNYAKNEMYALMVRATATSLLGNYSDDLSRETITFLLGDPKSLIRHTALTAYASSDLNDYLKNILPLLNDPTLAIRAEAAYKLSEIPRNLLNSDNLKKIDKGLIEFKSINEYAGDFPGGQFNLGNMYMNKGNVPLAMKAYKNALEIDPLFFQAKSNLAIIYNQQGNNKEAEKLLRELIRDFPELNEVYFSLSLLLAETKRMEESKKYMLEAAKRTPKRARIWYNLAIFEIQEGNIPQSEVYYLKALNLEPHNLEFLITITNYYLSINKKEKAKIHFSTLNKLYSTNPQVVELAKRF